MARDRTNRVVDDRIKQVSRGKARIDSPYPKAYTFKELEEYTPFALHNVGYRGLWLTSEKTTPPQTATSVDSWQVNNTGSASGTAGTSTSAGTYTVSGASWTVNEWQGFWLTVPNGIFQIRSNDATGGIVLFDATVVPAGGYYYINAHRRDSYNGLLLQPDIDINATFRIIDTTETAIIVEQVTSTIYNGQVSGLWTGVGGTGGLVEVPDVAVGTGDTVNYRLLALPQFGNILNLDFAGISSTDFVGDTYTGYAGWVIRFLDGDASGQTGDITAFDSASGHFSITGIDATVSTGDSFVLEATVGVLSGGQYAVHGGYYLDEYDFASANSEDLYLNTLVSPDGDFNLDGMVAGYTARYAVDLNAQRNMSIPIRAYVDDCNYKVKVNGATALYGSANGMLNVPAGWNRIEIYIYSEWGGRFSLYGHEKPIGEYFTNWRDTQPPAPAWNTISGYSTTPVEQGQVSLSWVNSGLLTQQGGTEIWVQPSGSSDFSLLDRVVSTMTTYTHTGLDANKNYTYKLRHYTAHGDLSEFTSERTGLTAPQTGSDGVVLNITADESYYTTGDTISIVVEVGNGAFIGLTGAPDVEVGGQSASFQTASTDGYFTRCTYQYNVTSGDTQGQINITATGTTTYGEVLTGSETVGLDFVAPVITDDDLILDSDDNLANGEQLWATVPNRVFIHPGQDIADTSGASGWASGLDKIRIINSIRGTSGAVGGSQKLTDPNILYSVLSGLNFSGYVLRDSLGNDFTISYIDSDSGYLRINTVSGNPASGAYTISRYPVDDSSNWTERDFNLSHATTWDLTVNMPFAIDTMPSNLPNSAAFRVYMCVTDSAGNVSNISSDEIKYNPSATNAPIVYHEFITGSGTVVYPNANGWLNTNPTKLRIHAEAPDSNLLITSIWTSLDGGAFTEHVIDADDGYYDLTLNQGANGTVDYYAETDAMAGAPQYVRVNYNLDYTGPIWVLGTKSFTGGFNRAILSWQNLPSDTLSGVEKIRVYRHTAFVPSASTEVAILGPNTYGHVDGSLASGNTYYYWTGAEDFAGNELRWNFIGSGTVEQIVAADVEGALRIESPYNSASADTEWQTRYGIKVPIEAVTMQFGTLPGNPDEIDHIEAIEYKANSSGSWTSVTNAKINGSSISFPYSVGAVDNTQLTISFDPVQDKEFWRVRFDNVNAEPWSIGSQLDRVDFNSILAADLIVAGVLRLETGLTVWSGGFDSNGDATGGGVSIDQAGLELWDASGNTAVALFGTPSGGNIAILGKTSGRQVFVDEDGNVKIDGGSLLLAKGGNLVKNSNFEAGIDAHWTRSGYDWSVSDLNAVNGQYSAKYAPVGVSSNGNTLYSDYIPVKPSGNYLASWYYKLTYTSGQWRVKIYEYDEDKSSITNTQIRLYTSSQGSFTRDSANITLNGNTRFVRLFIQATYGPANPEGTAYFDCFQLEEADNTDQEPSVWQPGGYTLIDGAVITTGKIQSDDGSTYFDLDNNKIVVDDGTGTVELSSASGLVATYDGRTTVNLGVKNGNAFFRGGVFGQRLSRIPELALAFDFEREDVSSNSIDTSSYIGGYGPAAVKVIRDKLFICGSNDLVKVDRFGAHAGSNTTTGLADENMRDIVYVGGDTLWTGGTYTGSGTRSSSNQRNLRKWSVSGHSIVTSLNLSSEGSGGLEVYGMAYDDINDYLWLSAFGGDQVSGSLYYVDLSDNSINSVSVTGKQDAISTGIAFDGKYIWFCTASYSVGAYNTARLHRWDVAAASGTYVSIGNNWAPGDVVYDGINVIATNTKAGTLNRFFVCTNPFSTTPTGSARVSSTYIPSNVVFDGKYYWCYTPVGFYRLDLNTEDYDLVPATFSALSESGVHGCFDGEGVWLPQDDAITLIT